MNAMTDAARKRADAIEKALATAPDNPTDHECAVTFAAALEAYFAHTVFHDAEAELCAPAFRFTPEPTND